jgi:hypothetical protein
MSIGRLVVKLGYSERAFRHKFAITPAQFRELSLVGDDEDHKQNLSTIAQNMPPLHTHLYIVCGNRNRNR